MEPTSFLASPSAPAMVLGWAELEFGLPLPRAVPYVTTKGVAFIYQQYEIVCYAAGLPSVVIPAEELRDLLSEEGRALLDVE